MSLRTYQLTIVFDDETDTVEYIEEGMSESASELIEAYTIEIDAEYCDDELLRELIKHGIVGES